MLRFIVVAAALLHLAAATDKECKKGWSTVPQIVSEACNTRLIVV